MAENYYSEPRENDRGIPQTMTRLCSIEIIGRNIQIQERADDGQSATLKSLEKECQRKP